MTPLYRISTAICAILIIVDQISKYVAVTYLRPVGTVPVIQNIFAFTFVENRGAAFGILQGARIGFLIVTPLIVAGLIYYFIKLPHDRVYTFVRAALVLVTAGAIGNYIDRLFRGYVVDFLHATFINFPVFNLADVFVVTGTALLAVLIIFFIRDEPEIVK
ncbi:MAG: signal peptidase II [Defluviitaleaceae bacterium]|nr:signal peptidase II [Defluviitaleaceae bacterium]